MRVWVALGVAASLAWAAAAGAQPGTPQPPYPPNRAPAVPGRAFATVHQPVPANIAFRVRALNNSPANVRIARLVADAMPRGRVGGPTLTVTVETEMNPIAIRQPDTRWYDSDGHYYQLRIPLGRRSAEPPRGGAPEAGPPRSMQFVLFLTLDDPQSGVRIWEGRAYYTALADDEEPAFAGMARILGEMVGRTVRTRQFRLD